MGSASSTATAAVVPVPRNDAQDSVSVGLVAGKIGKIFPKGYRGDIM